MPCSLTNCIAIYSPTYSSGNHISSINNWAEAAAAISKKDDLSTAMLDDNAKILVHSSDLTGDVDRTQNLNVDFTPMGQLGLQQHNFSAGNIPSYGISPKGSSTTNFSTKHNASSFATHAMKSTTLMKTQSDKSGSKEKKQTDSNEKDHESQAVRRSSYREKYRSDSKYSTDIHLMHKIQILLLTQHIHLIPTRLLFIHSIKACMSTTSQAERLDKSLRERLNRKNL